MKAFTELLLRIQRRLDLPQPQKSRIMLEIAADMRDLFDELINRGYSDSRALAEVETKFDLSAEALENLSIIHRGAIQKWMEKLSARKRKLWEWLLFTIFMLFFCGHLGWMEASTGLLAAGGNFVYPITLLLIFAVSVFLVKIYRFFVLSNHALTTLRNGVNIIKYSIGAVLFLGISGYFLEMFLLESPTIYLGPFLFITIVDFSRELTPAIEAMTRISALMMISLFAAMLLSGFWFILENKISGIEKAECEILFQK